MSHVAFGAYLRELRRLQQIRPEEIAYKIERTVEQLYRWERGEDVPKLNEAVVRCVRLVNGSAEDVFDLILDGDATVEDGVMRALVQMQGGRRMSDEELLKQLAERLARHNS